MGVSRSPEELARKLGTMAVAFSRYDSEVVRIAAQATKQTIQATSPSRLRGVGKRGARLNVRYTLTTTADNPAALVFATGPWQLIERDTKPHDIPKVRGKRARRRYAVIDGHPYARAHHPGTRGQHPWAKGVEIAKPVIGRVFDQGAGLIMGRIF
jgi:hypothetical protein